MGSKKWYAKPSSNAIHDITQFRRTILIRIMDSQLSYFAAWQTYLIIFTLLIRANFYVFCLVLHEAYAGVTEGGGRVDSPQVWRFL